MLDTSPSLVDIPEARTRIKKAVMVVIACHLMPNEEAKLIEVPRGAALNGLKHLQLDTLVVCELKPNGLCVLGAV